MAKTTRPLVGVMMGSDSDLPTMQRCLDQLAALGIGYEARILSAHRSPEAVGEYAQTAVRRGLKVLIAGAGMSAALAGALAAKTTLPVIGVPMDSGPLRGLDAALSTMQMPPGVPVGCMSIGPAGATNAAVYAAEILATADKALARRLARFKTDQTRRVQQKDEDFQRRMKGADARKGRLRNG